MLQGFLAHRAALNSLDFVDGFQWCAGSFVEDKIPNDLDVVTFFHRPADSATQAQFGALAQQNRELFDPRLTKQKYHCDAYFVDFILPPEQLTARTHYWFGLFSHRRVTAEWKGLVQVTLHSPDDDNAAMTVLKASTETQVRP